MNFFIQRLYGTTSMSLIDVLIEEQGRELARFNADHQKLMNLIYECNDLDLRHAYCADFLGYAKQAKHLFDRAQLKASR